MELDLEGELAERAYPILASLVTPRPIAFVTTVSPDGKVNAAPFSFFNLLGANPPILAFAPGDREDGTPKDTARNIRLTHEFVVNLVDEAIADAMNKCAASLPYADALILAPVVDVYSRDRNDVIFNNRTAQLGCPTLPGFLSHQVLSQGRLRRNHGDFLALAFNPQAAVLWPDEIEGAHAAGIQFQQGGQINGFIGGEIPGGQGFVEFDGILYLLRLAGLPGCQISRL